MLLKTTLTFTLALSAIALTSCSDDRRGDGNVVFVGCGDGNQQSTEECDDGNRTNGDGCSAACTIENSNATCGNSVVETGEQCDDGNTAGGDGCSAACQLENAANCGNGTLDAGEQCDDGNTTSGDGCSATCQTEGGGAVCGNGTVEAGETCDDGNTTSGDGCSSTCQTEGGAVCGNGLVEAGETCDDGNTTSGDGCSSTCQTEGMAVCGNGLVEAGETCDDGNTTSGDGCDSECQTEMMGTTCQQACNHVFNCAQMQCPGTYDEQACVNACLMDPAGFMPEAVAALSCAEINAQVCVQMQETDAGNPCMADADCNAGTLQAFCFLADDGGMATPWVGGYCTAIGCRADEECGTNKFCVTIDQMGTTACFQGCMPSNNGAGVCRMGYQCPDLSGGMGIGVCLPNCTGDADCNTGQTCNLATGQCT